MSAEPRRLAVLGSPIAHSKSPALHAAAYRVLGLDWEYRAVDVTEDALGAFLGSTDAAWRGLSLTMPLKRTVLPLLDRRDDVVRLTGAANTVLLEDDGTRSGFNTDVAGLERAFAAAGVHVVRHAVVLGGGATAGSAIAALARLGVESVVLRLRRPEAAADLVPLAEAAGVALTALPFGEPNGRIADAVVGTLPAGAAVELAPGERPGEAPVYFEVAYAPWPTPRATAWQEAGGLVVPGLEMLVEQALLQVRIFVGGDTLTPLPGELDVLAAMRASVAL
jgi:shikimate dehydrogenase